jgi:hypothetical protein
MGADQQVERRTDLRYVIVLTPDELLTTTRAVLNASISLAQLSGHSLRNACALPSRLPPLQIRKRRTL